MKTTNSKIGLYYNRKRKYYELRMVAFNYDEYDPNLKWVFDHTKYDLAMRIQHCMNSDY